LIFIDTAVYLMLTFRSGLRETSFGCVIRSLAMINVSELAAGKLKEILEEEGKPEASLRLLASPGTNGGVSYMLTVEAEPKTSDSVVHSNGVNIVVDNDSASLIDGTEIDYVEGLMRSGFVVNNPNFATEMGGGGCGSEGGCACGGQCSCGGH
jgi:iron-sulfur cluster assembly accessory protein